MSVFLSLTPLLEAAPEWLSQNSVIKGAMVPVYFPGEPAPAAVLRLGRVSSDYERRGFFRIGLLPLVAVEDARIELMAGAKLTNALSRAHGWLEHFAAGRHLELRQVSLLFPPEKTPRLLAGRARLDRQGRWLLSGGITLRDGASQIQISQATLQATGAQTGWLTWETTNAPARVNLFSISNQITADIQTTRSL